MSPDVTLPLSVVVVAHDMARELPRTLHSLSPSFQRDIEPADYEVIVVDNGSAAPVPPEVLDAFEGRGRLERIDAASPSPAAAANLGVGRAQGELVGLIIDGARLASPGLLATALLARRLADRPVVASLGWHLGPVRHMEAAEAGYDGETEDRILAEIGWPEPGYRLFEVSTLAGSSGRGWFGPLGESSALFLPAATWAALDGLDEAFTLPGGGLVNHDLYRRACDLEGSRLVVLLGEGTFHQIHGGAATSRRFTWDDMAADYERLRGAPYRPPAAAPLFVGRVPPESLGQLGTSITLAQQRAIRRGASGTRPG